MKQWVLLLLLSIALSIALSIGATPANAADTRQLTLAEYRDKVLGAWTGQVVGALFGFPFEGKPKNVLTLDHYLQEWKSAPVDDDYYYEMVALYGFERFGLGMTVEQLGDMWKEYRAGTWGSSEQARLALERGIRAPHTGEPRYNRWFHTIGPEFSSDIYGMISPGMINTAGRLARTYSHVNGYAEGSDGAVFVAACISEAFFEKQTLAIVRRAAQLIDPRSNYRKAIDEILAAYERGENWRQAARESENRWRPDYPQLNNSVANGALVALGLLYGDGDYLNSINIVTAAGDFTDADCNAANVGSVVGAMRGAGGLPRQLVEPLHDRIYGDGMGPLKLGRVIDERITDIARRVAAAGEKNAVAHGAKLTGERLEIPRQTPEQQALESFDINEYAHLWNPEWTMEGGARGGPGATYLDGDVLVTFPRDGRPVRLERSAQLPPVTAMLRLQVGAEADRPWRLDFYVDDERVFSQTVSVMGGAKGIKWHEFTIDVSRYAGKPVTLRAYHYVVEGKPAGAAFWRSIDLSEK